LLKAGAVLVERDLGRDPLTVAELKDLFAGRDPRGFLNTRNELYRSRKMAQDPPSPAETVRLMAQNPNLIRRPIVARGGERVLGYDESALLRLAGSRRRSRRT
jgi:arsenate reductase-like glutaredoxin family protein